MRRTLAKSILCLTVVWSTATQHLDCVVASSTTAPSSNTAPTTLSIRQRVHSRGGASTAASAVMVSPSPATASSSLSVFTRARQTIFPIYGHEIRKFFLLGSIKFFIILALTLTRDTKDTLVVTQCGAEAIAFLKIYGVLPAATLFIAFYSKLSDRLDKTTLFYVTCVPFFCFFQAFDWFLYPNAHKVQPSLETVQAWFGLTAATTGGTAVLCKIIANWTSAVFYILSEIYSSVSVGLLFWQYANDVVPMQQAKRFYPLFAQMSGLAPVLAGQYVVKYASRAEDFEESLHRLTAAVSFSGCAICVFYYLSNAYVERMKIVEGAAASGGKASITTKEADASLQQQTKKKKKKPKMSMAESAKFLAQSQYLRLIATLVLGYGLSINFTEIMWKSLVKKQYPNPLDYQRFMGNFSSAVGLSTCIVIFFGVHVIRILGWRIGAIATPAIMALLAAPFFGCILLGLDSPTRLSVAVLFGTIQSLLSKTFKYALFDPTTQMAYIPLDDESKVKGKAAIDVLGSRIGKSGGSLIQQGLVVFFGNIISAAPVVGVIFYTVLLTWIGAANRLSGLFHAQTEMDKAARMEKEK
ncbi:TLC ATP/ADP transporter [Mayamaea pseudoterrestris]|nr:TLC ATP/ADP transporter [Mayamaea pseudoterrestris]GKY90914.1 TLC ATP/ADP transporter [Mayamaea pseudoterrestris]